MISLLLSCIADNEAQDLIEYSLLIAFVICTMFGLVLGLGTSVQTITNISDSQLNAAAGMVH